MEKIWINIPDVLFFQEGPGVRNTQYTTEGVKLLNVANLVDGKVDLSKSDRYISEDEAYGKYKHFLCDAGDFVIASSGIKVEYIDKKMGFVDESMLPLCMNTSTIRFKVLDDNKLRIRYFMYYLKSQHFKDQLFKQITGSAQLNYGPSHLKKMIMPLISLSKQDEIIACMDKVQSVIEMRRQELVKLDDLIKARFVEMFGDLMINDKEWQKAKISDICVEIVDCINKTAPTVEYETEYKMLRTTNVKNGDVNITEVKYVKREEFEKWTRRSVPRNGDVLLTREAPMGQVGILQGVKNDVFLGQRLVSYRCNFVKMNSVFLTYQMMSKYFQNQIEKTGKGSTVKHIPVPVCTEFEIFVPPIELQKQFADFVNQVNKSKVAVLKNYSQGGVLSYDNQF